ncbi:MFS transporter [Nocardia bovistercoris]|uniref:MFS transporter n=1 Tax=Nocardia bovistercoris TaxID=2785916 RepID=A0A931ID71_9NOCA|nr:MFS transporter [Nocardia bovistercoris]MBH0779264.1 MFS transporter [Nocardia bovistercoris]
MRFSIQDWFRAAFVMFGVGWGANQFSPMAGVYERDTNLSGAAFAALFGVYAAGLIPALLITGAVADRRGRRWVTIRTAVLSIVATIVLICGPGEVAVMGSARFLAGIASGAAFVAGSAWVKELSAGAAEGAGARRAAIALSAGFGAGPLVSGAVAQWLPLATSAPYFPHLVLMLPAVLLVRRCPDPASTRLGPRTPLPEMVRTRGFLVGVLPWAPWVFGAATTSFVTAAKLASAHAGGLPIAFSGAVAGLTLLTGVLIQPLARRLDSRGAQWPPVVGLLLAGGGFVVTAVLAETAGARYQVALILPAAVLLGAAYGILLVAGLLAVQRLAEPDELASAVAVFYTLIYLGFAAPYLLEVLSGGVDWAPWLIVEAVVTSVTAAVVVVNARVTTARSAPVRHDEVVAAPLSRSVSIDE